MTINIEKLSKIGKIVFYMFFYNFVSTTNFVTFPLLLFLFIYQIHD